MPNEIITLQLGSYANHVGTHWWNIQESSFAYNDGEELSEIDPDAMFREGETLRGEVTFTPRLILLDTKDSLGSLPVHDSLYNGQSYGEDDGHTLWDNEVEVKQSEVAHKNEFLQDLEDEMFYYYMNGTTNGDSSHASADKYKLDKVVQTWSDYKRILYHPRTTVLIDSNPIDKSKFDSFHFGTEEAKSESVWNEIEESLRFFAEGCDALQGFHLLCNMHDAFGGMASVVSEYLSDEFKGKTCASFPLLQPPGKIASGVQLRNRSLSSILTLASMLDNCGMAVPLSLCQEPFKASTKTFPNLIYDASDYHTSAIVAAGLENMSRMYRLRDRQSSISNIAVTMTSGSRKLLGMSCSLPLPYNHVAQECFADFLCDFADENFYHSLTPCTDSGSGLSEFTVKTFSQNVSLCGLTPLEFETPPHLMQQSALHQCTNPKEMIKMYMKERFQNQHCDVTVLEQPIKTFVPFPQIFSKSVQCDGSVTNFSKQTTFSDQYTEYLLNGNLSPTSCAKMTNGHAAKKATTSSAVASVPMATVLESSTTLGKLLKSCHEQGSLLKKWHAQCGHADAESDLTEAVEKFRTLERDYRVLTEFDEDSDDESD